MSDRKDLSMESILARAFHNKYHRPYTLQGTVIKCRQQEALTIIKRLQTLLKYTPQERTANSLINELIEVLEKITELVMELELKQ